MCRFESQLLKSFVAAILNTPHSVTGSSTALLLPIGRSVFPVSPGKPAVFIQLSVRFSQPLLANVEMKGIEVWKKLSKSAVK